MSPKTARKKGPTAIQRLRASRRKRSEKIVRNLRRFTIEANATEFKKLEKTIAPLAKQLGELGSASDTQMKAVLQLHRLIITTIAQALKAGYPYPRAREIVDMAEGAMRAFVDAQAALEACLDHNDQAVEELADFLSLGPNQPSD